MGDGPDRARLESLSHTLGVGRQVRFTGTVTDTRAPLALMQAVIFIPAEKEGFGLSLLEAMACGKPIVSINRGYGASWILQESQVGVLVEDNGPAPLAAAMIELLEQPERARELGQKARAIAAERYSLDRMMDAIEQLYKELVGSNQQFRAPHHAHQEHRG